MDILQELQNFINDFNQDNGVDFGIDSIRTEFQKQYKLERLLQIGTWRKVGKNSNILHKLKKRFPETEVTSVYRLEQYNIYYYNKKDDTKKYRKAEMVIFGMKQYHKDAPPQEIINKILAILKNVSNIDICFDMPYKPSYEALEKYFVLTPYRTKDGILTDTRYINETGVMMLDKITIYNKAFKNELNGILWRMEAKISIPNIKALALPLHEFKEIISICHT